MCGGGIEQDFFLCFDGMDGGKNPTWCKIIEAVVWPLMQVFEVFREGHWDGFF
jgi:hypothetical protein